MISFEWTIKETDGDRLQLAGELDAEIELIPVVPREEPKPELKPTLPPVEKIIRPVDNDVVIEDMPVWSSEVGDEPYIDPDLFPEPGDEEEIVDEPVIRAEIMPRFNGGKPEVEFYRFIQRHLRYPGEAAKNGVQGRVTVQFVIDRTGSLVNARVVQGVHPALDNEALRVINLSPEWEPGIQNGNMVSVIYTFPIHFRLQ